MTDDRRDRLDEADRVFAFVARIILFFVGTALFVFSVVFSPAGPTERLIVMAISVGLMGRVAIAGVAQAVYILRGGKHE